jgi:hypothetical protein
VGERPVIAGNGQRVGPSLVRAGFAEIFRVEVPLAVAGFGEKLAVTLDGTPEMLSAADVNLGEPLTESEKGIFLWRQRPNALTDRLFRPYPTRWTFLGLPEAKK